MFNGYINFTDLLLIIEKIKKGYFSRIVSRLTKNKTGKIQEAWIPFETPTRFWLDIPYVSRRNNYLQSGSYDQDIYEYVAKKYFINKINLKGLSFCCGTGEHEKKWASTGAFSSIDGFDISPGCVQTANASVKGTHLENVLHFHEKDVWGIDVPENHYDVIFAMAALHHIESVSSFIQKVRRWLKPNGLFIVWDFFGPDRFQWTKRQLEVMNGILKILPESYRKQWKSGTIKQRVYRPGKLLMILNDASEAVESSLIRPALLQNFLIKEERQLGGTILQLLLDDIALNFLNNDIPTKSYLDLCFSIEDLFINVEKQPSDMMFGVYAKN